MQEKKQNINFSEIIDIKLYNHQKRLVAKGPDRIALVHATGTGKTITAMALANLKGHSVLVICPLGLKEQWRRALQKYSKVPSLIMSKEEFRKSWEITPEYKTVIVDEAHHYFGMKSQMSHSLRDYFKLWNTPFRYLLTATPYRSSPWDVYVMMILLGYKPSYHRFSTMFFNLIPMGGRRILVAKANIEAALAEVVGKMGDIVRQTSDV